MKYSIANKLHITKLKTLVPGTYFTPDSSGCLYRVVKLAHYIQIVNPYNLDGSNTTVMNCNTGDIMLLDNQTMVTMHEQVEPAKFRPRE